MSIERDDSYYRYRFNSSTAPQEQPAQAPPMEASMAPANGYEVVSQQNAEDPRIHACPQGKFNIFGTNGPYRPSLKIPVYATWGHARHGVGINVSNTQPTTDLHAPNYEQQFCCPFGTKWAMEKTGVFEKWIDANTSVPLPLGVKGKYSINCCGGDRAPESTQDAVDLYNRGCYGGLGFSGGARAGRNLLGKATPAYRVVDNHLDDSAQLAADGDVTVDEDAGAGADGDGGDGGLQVDAAFAWQHGEALL